MTDIQLIGDIFGYISAIVWSVSFYPQVFINIKYAS